jgi:hypothetical protein
MILRGHRQRHAPSLACESACVGRVSSGARVPGEGHAGYVVRTQHSARMLAASTRPPVAMSDARRWRLFRLRLRSPVVLIHGRVR